jgi:hypothetical protein
MTLAQNTRHKADLFSLRTSFAIAIEITQDKN